MRLTLYILALLIIASGTYAIQHLLMGDTSLKSEVQRLEALANQMGKIEYVPYLDLNRIDTYEEQLRELRSRNDEQVYEIDSQAQQILELDALLAEAQIFKMQGYREFKTLPELRKWLENDPISEREYIKNIYDCDDFAIDLAKAGIADNYWIGILIDGNHAMNFMFIKNHIWLIEPQTDEISSLGFQDIDVK